MLVVRRIGSVFGAMLAVLLVSSLASASPGSPKPIHISQSAAALPMIWMHSCKSTGRLPFHGFRHPGATQIKFGGEVTYLETDRDCSIGDINVTLKTHITLPQWVNRRQANGTLGLIWDTLSADIKRHEERHAEIAAATPVSWKQS